MTDILLSDTHRSSSYTAQCAVQAQTHPHRINLCALVQIDVSQLSRLGFPHKPDSHETSVSVQQQQTFFTLNYSPVSC